MKKMILLFTALMMVLTIAPAAMGAFEDEPSVDHWVYENFWVVYEAGLIKGYPDGTFKGERPATRYEMVEVMARLVKYIERRIAEEGMGLTEARVKQLIAEEITNSDFSADQVYDAIENLEIALAEDLSQLDARITNVEREVEQLKQNNEDLAKRIAALEKREKGETKEGSKVLGILGIILGIAGCFLP